MSPSSDCTVVASLAMYQKKKRLAIHHENRQQSIRLKSRRLADFLMAPGSVVSHDVSETKGVSNEQ